MPSRPVISGAPAASATPFIGRRREVTDARRLLGPTPVLTLAGPPGVGKTRLALRTAEESAGTFADGAWFVDLAGLRDPALLSQEVARALGLLDTSTRWAVDRLAHHIADRSMLLVLDTCEHLLDACAVLVDSLTRTCPRLRVLCTSRQPLGIRSETVLRVAPLSVPAAGDVGGEAVDLLLARAAALLHDYTPDATDLAAAAALCRRLDGIPLAIELAAVRLRSLTLQQILERLDGRFTVLGTHDRTAPQHQRTLRAALDWSRDLATDEERMLWGRLSVFPTTFDLAAAEAVCGDRRLPTDRVLDALDGLVDKSLLSATRAGAAVRYRLLDSIREYGRGLLPGDGEPDTLAARHAAYYGGLARQAWTHWTDAEQPHWFDRLDTEHDNLRAALDWALHHGVDAGCAMAADMWLYWEARGHITEGRRRLAALLDREPTDRAARLHATWVLGYLALAQNDVGAALPLLQSVAGADARAAGAARSVAFATQYLGQCHLFAGDLAAAGDQLRRAVDLHTGQGSRAAAFALSDLAVVTMLGGDSGRAVGLYEEALEMTATGGDPWTRSHAFWGLGVATFLHGDLDRAEAAERDALALIGGLDERSGIALCLEALAWISAARGDVQRAARLQGASSAVWESIPSRLPDPMQVHARRCEDLTTRKLGSARRAQLFAHGRRLERAAAVALGLGAPDPAARRTGPAHASVLSRREDEVAALVAQGMTDREIAARLHISQRTAESHVQHILSKLGFRSRARIAAWVTERDAAS